MTPNNEKAFFEWLDEQIIHYIKLEEDEFMDERSINYYLGQIQAFKKAQDKFLSPTQPQSINNDKTSNNV